MSCRLPNQCKPHYTGLIEQYRHRLPLDASTKAIELGEGQTPLIKLENIPEFTGKNIDIYVKYEGLNPTGSFKDRGMTMAVTNAVANGSKSVICASTGNTSAAAAAYAARAGIKAYVLIPEGKIAMGKMAQAMMYGAVIIQIRGNFDQGMQLVKDVAEHAPVAIVNSVNPYRLHGQKTGAFEIVEALGTAPDYHYLPVGNAGNITAHWLGYCEYAGKETKSKSEAYLNCYEGGVAPKQDIITDKTPIMVGYQAENSAPFMRGEMVDNPETVATAIRIGHPQSWPLAWDASKESGGWFGELSDADILKAQRLLASKEGIFCEPASAASLGGALRDIELGKIPEGSSIVCTLTGHGLKDPGTAIEQCKEMNIMTIDATLNGVKNAILNN